MWYDFASVYIKLKTFGPSPFFLDANSKIVLYEGIYVYTVQCGKFWVYYWLWRSRVYSIPVFFFMISLNVYTLFKNKWYMLDEITIVKWFIIFHILYIHVLIENLGNSFYGKFWMFLIDHFVRHICLISYECTLYIYVCLEKCKRIKKDWHFKPFDLFV